MANAMYHSGKGAIISGASTGTHIKQTVNLLSDANIEIIALENDTGEDLTHNTVQDAITAGAVEVTSTGYTGGYGGSSRQSLASKSYTVDQSNGRWEFDCANVTWSSINQAGSETWVAFLIAKRGTSDDTTAQLIAHIDSGTGLPLTPNGSDIEFQVDPEGLLHLT
jgi:hypothetical protein